MSRSLPSLCIQPTGRQPPAQQPVGLGRHLPRAGRDPLLRQLEQDLQLLHRTQVWSPCQKRCLPILNSFIPNYFALLCLWINPHKIVSYAPLLGNLTSSLPRWWRWLWLPRRWLQTNHHHCEANPDTDWQLWSALVSGHDQQTVQQQVWTHLSTRWCQVRKTGGQWQL